VPGNPQGNKGREKSACPHSCSGSRLDYPPPNKPDYRGRLATMMEAFNWLEREGHLIRNSEQPTGDWFTISRSG
jgi:hypothetical protein